MDPLTTEILTGVYLATNGLRVLSYIPQIVRVYKDSSGAQAIALSTWSFWALSNGTTFLYAVAVLKDPFLSCVSAGNTLCCTLVVTIVVARRQRTPRQQLASLFTTPVSFRVKK